MGFDRSADDPVGLPAYRYGSRKRNHAMAQTPQKRFTVNAAFFQEIKEDHQQLHDIMDQLRRLVDNKPALGNHVADLANLTEALRDQLAFHFALEEAYGYFEDAIGMAPWIHEKAGALRDQHGELFTQAQDLAELAADYLQRGDDDPAEVGERFVEFDRAFSEHESAEVALILNAMTQDVGAAD
ncbi:MAG: hemerythrin domain-containing protein [Planctomycetota bacterium]|nr:MAG: hemerythrin domain-containing protein [Planctomycetota bacterium]